MVLSSCGAVLRNELESARALGQYEHQSNDCGTVDSTCRRCGLTVGRAYREGALFQLEQRHVCQSVERRQATRVAHQIFNPAVAVV